MAMAAYDAFSLMNQLQREVNRLFDAPASTQRRRRTAAVSGNWFPSVDIQEEAGQYVINADLPGVDPKDIEVTMEKGVLTLRGRRDVQGVAENPDFKRRERPTGSFRRDFVMPGDADAEGISALAKNGVVQVLIPKRRKAQAHRIPVDG